MVSLVQVVFVYFLEVVHVKKLFSLLVLCSSAALFSASMGKDERELKSCDKVVAHLDLKSQEPITNKAFADIVLEDAEANVHPIIARVRHDGNHTIYDAYQFNNLVFKNKCLGKSETDISRNAFADPMSKKRVTDIRYFILYSPDGAFETIGSLAGMNISSSRSEFVRALLHANNPQILLAQKALTFQAIGQKYALGAGAGKPDAQKAMYWYQKAINQDENPRAQAKANYSIGQMYHDGQAGVEKDYAKAAKFYGAAIDQGSVIGPNQRRVSTESDEWSRFNLARILARGGHGKDKDWPRAQILLMGLIREASIAEVKEQAKQAYERYVAEAKKNQQDSTEGYMLRFGSAKQRIYMPSEEEKRKKLEAMADVYVVDSKDVPGLREKLQKVLSSSNGDMSEKNASPRDDGN